MALTKYKFGDLLELTNQKNTSLQCSAEDAIGVNIDKVILPMRGDTEAKDVSTFHLVPPRHFAYNPRGSRKLGIGFNNTEKTYIITFNDNVFRVKENAHDILIEEYLFMYLCRKEWDRYAEFISWGSSTEVFDWNEFCNEEIDLPSIDIQRKYVAIYNALLANQQSYERGLDDLKLVCDGYFDQAKSETLISLGELIEKVDKKNIDGKLGAESVRGITNKKQFDKTKANISDTDLSAFLLIEKDTFAYNSRTDGRDMLVCALNKSDDSVIVTWNYNAFKIKDSMKSKYNVDYLYSYLCREEFDRLIRFHSWGSSQELISWDSLCEIKVPFPSIDVQTSIADIYNIYNERKNLKEKMKAQIKDICPILIKGSIEEGRKEK